MTRGRPASLVIQSSVRFVVELAIEPHAICPTVAVIHLQTVSRPAQVENPCHTRWSETLDTVSKGKPGPNGAFKPLFVSDLPAGTACP